tara:strand:- start:1692 stop:2597 length:906 start_codon:yes stop_codon:yes gene_type:complete
VNKLSLLTELLAAAPNMEPEDWISQGLKLLQLEKAGLPQAEIDFIQAACQFGESACRRVKTAEKREIDIWRESTKKRNVLQEQHNTELQTILDNLNVLKVEAGHMISNAGNQQVFLNAVSAERDGLRDELNTLRRENSQLNRRLSAASVDFQLAGVKSEKKAVEHEVAVKYLKARLLEALESKTPQPPVKPTMQEFTKRAHQTAVSKGWWDDVDDADALVPEKLCLIHSEVSEALESYRNGEDMLWITDTGKPEGLLAELADVVIRCADLSEALGLDLGSAMSVKMDYNDTRPHRHGDKKC